MASVELRNVSKSFGRFQAIEEVSLTIPDRELVVFVGPSGCGKSTLLRMIAGLEEMTSGELTIGGKPMNDVAAAKRGIAMVFQSYALYPHMNVAENMGFGLKMLGVDKATVEGKVAAAAAVLQIGHLLERQPRELSGGERQRVAIGRALVRTPDVFLFDEPLSNLDADLRAQMRVEIARLHERLEATMIYVTHDQIEAMTLASRIVVLNKGRVEQEGRPLDLYERPANRFVAGFIGQPKMNFLPVGIERNGGDLDARLDPDGPVLVTGAALGSLTPGSKAELGIRPTDISLGDTGTPAEIALVEHLGSSSIVYLSVPGWSGLLTVEEPRVVRAAVGSRVHFRLDTERLHVFDTNGERIESGP